MFTCYVCGHQVETEGGFRKHLIVHKMAYDRINREIYPVEPSLAEARLEKRKKDQQHKGPGKSSAAQRSVSPTLPPTLAARPAGQHGPRGRASREQYQQRRSQARSERRRAEREGRTKVTTCNRLIPGRPVASSTSPPPPKMRSKIVHRPVIDDSDTEVDDIPPTLEKMTITIDCDDQNGGDDEFGEPPNIVLDMNNNDNLHNTDEGHDSDGNVSLLSELSNPDQVLEEIGQQAWNQIKDSLYDEDVEGDGDFTPDPPILQSSRMTAFEASPSGVKIATQSAGEGSGTQYTAPEIVEDSDEDEQEEAGDITPRVRDPEGPFGLSPTYIAELVRLAPTYTLEAFIHILVPPDMLDHDDIPTVRLMIKTAIAMEKCLSQDANNIWHSRIREGYSTTAAVPFVQAILQAAINRPTLQELDDEGNPILPEAHQDDDDELEEGEVPYDQDDA